MIIPRQANSAMLRHISVKQFVGASVALPGLLGVWSWYRSHSPPAGAARTRLESTHLPAASEERTREPLSSVEVTRSAPLEQSPSAVTRISAAAPPTKTEALSKALEERPPALTDPHTELRSDPERQHRYAARAARAERLNQRLSQHIEALEARLAEAAGAEQGAIEAELAQLRANLAKRQDLQRAAIPMPATRTGS